MRPRVGSSAIKMVDAALREVEYSSLVISGFLKSETGFAESFIFDVAHSTQKYEEIIAVADDVAFARKRIVSPKAVYRYPPPFSLPVAISSTPHMLPSKHHSD